MGKKKQRKKMMRAAMVEGFEGGYGFEPSAYARRGRGPRHDHRLGVPGMGLGLDRLASTPTQQFLLGALVGGAATYALSDKALREKLIKSALKLYEGLIGGVEEMKEQIADLKAELETGQQSTDE